ncbi:MAG TPA: hypothetical protein DE179_06450 [Oceanospirillaceae bacterium]|nr:hypothetical protein [Oceanospirillaceae bacterium]
MIELDWRKVFTLYKHYKGLEVFELGDRHFLSAAPLNKSQSLVYREQTQSSTILFWCGPSAARLGSDSNPSQPRGVEV